MIFEQLIYTDLGCASYLIGCQGTAEAIVVDPALDTRPLERALAHHKHCDLSASERWKAIAVMVPGKTVCLLHARRVCALAARKISYTLAHTHREKCIFALWSFCTSKWHLA